MLFGCILLIIADYVLLSLGHAVEEMFNFKPNHQQRQVDIMILLGIAKLRKIAILILGLPLQNKQTKN